MTHFHKNAPKSTISNTQMPFMLIILFKSTFNRDESLDSGIASHDSTSDNHQNQMETSIMRRSRRRFEMVPGPSRHKFEIRDLNDYNEDSVIVPLSLPRLPTDRKEIVTEGLIRSTNSYSTDNEMDMSMSISDCGSRPISFISTTSEAESFEEEKLKMDNSLSEKSYKVSSFNLIHAYAHNLLIISFWILF